jgi:hypothetical protein
VFCDQPVKRNNEKIKSNRNLNKNVHIAQSFQVRKLIFISFTKLNKKI